jgi:hypothetical protein
MWRGALLAALLAGCVRGWAQRTAAPAASSGPISAIGADNDVQTREGETPSEGVQPTDIASVPASSVKLPTLGGMPQLFNYGLRIMQIASTNTQQAGGGNTLQSVSMISGNSSLHRRWGRSNLSFSYNGAESILAGGDLDPRFISAHQGSISAWLAKQRWSLGLSDAVSYAPQSSFGLGSLGGIGSNPLGFAAGLRPGLYPNESVLNSGSRTSNTSLAEIGYQLSRRNSLRASGGFGILRFRETGFSNSTQYNVGLGFDRVLSRRSNLSLSYNFFRTASSGFQPVQSHSALLGYTRQLSSRMMVQLSAGPQVQVQSSSSGANAVRWTTSNTLLYQMERSSLTLGYSAGIVGGSGVYGAARNHTVQAAISRPVARFWSGSVSFGFAHNAGVGTSSTLNSEYAGITIGRQLAGMGLSLSYQFQHQAIGSACSGLACAAFGGWSHTFGLGLDWIFRPVRIG